MSDNETSDEERELTPQQKGLLRTYPGQTVSRIRQRKDRAGQRLPWERDPVILERMTVVGKLWAEGRTEPVILDAVNAWAHEHGYPEISLRTIRADKDRILQKPKHELEEIRQAHIESFDHLKAMAYDRIAAEGVGSNAAAQLASVIERLEADKAKITGAMVHRVEQKITITEDETSRILVRVIAERFGEDEAWLILEAVQREIEGVQAPKHVVDAKAIDMGADIEDRD